jgi:GT2 family glycosyltransferase/glycosyltransferase involved in cell wall biosynthesis
VKRENVKRENVEHEMKRETHITFHASRFTTDWLRGVLLVLAFPLFIILLIPLAFGIVASLLVADIVGYLTRNTQYAIRNTEVARPDTSRASIIIPNWNGRELLEQCLPSVVEAVRSDGEDHEIIVVDNHSTDDSVPFLKANYPEVKVLELDRNRGFAGGCNAGAAESQNEIIVFLNNDMIVDRRFLRPLLDGFNDETVFAVASQIYFWDAEKRREETGQTRGFLKLGFLQVVHDEPSPLYPPLSGGDRGGRARPVLYAGGGSSAFDKKKFLALGGFDELFQPFYWEDTDVSYRAWKTGWKVLYEPRSVVFHQHRGTIGKTYDVDFTHKAVNRNHFLFLWKNFTDPSLLILHPFVLLGRLAWNYAQGNFTYLAAFGSAVSQLREVWKRRTGGDRRRRLSDREILAVSSDLFQYKEMFETQSSKLKAQTSLRPATCDLRPATRDLRPVASKNILFICPYIPCEGVHAGAGRMHTMIRLLAQRHQVSVVTFIDKESELKYVPELEEYCQEVVVIHRKPPYRRRNPLVLEPFVVSEFNSPQMGAEIHRLLSERDFDIVQVEYTQMAQYVPNTRRSCTLLTEHEVAFATHRRAFESFPFSWEKFRALMGSLIMMDYELKACRRFDKIITLTDADKKDLLSFEPGLDIEVVPMAVDGSWFMPQNTSEEPNSLVFIGYFRHSPNVHGIMRFCREILPLIRQDIPDTKLFIVGSSPPDEIIRLGKMDNVVVTGWVEDIKPYIARSSVYVAPLWLGTGMRVKILEAWGMAKPVVTTSIGSQGIDCTPGENVLIANDPQGFAAQTVRLLRDKALREKLGRNGRKQVQSKYDWEIIIQQVEEMYDEVLATKLLTRPAG